MIREFLLVLLLDNVEMTWQTEYILEDLNDVITSPIVITSGARTPEEQAKLMIHHHHSGKNLVKLYGQKVYKYLPLIRASNLEELTQGFTKDSSISAHLLGRAVDIRSRNLDKKTKNEIFSLTKGGSYDIIEEYSPPHIHVELNPGKMTYREVLESLWY